MTSVQTAQAPSGLPTAEALRAKARDALQAIGSRADLGEPADHGVHASTPITGDVLFTIAETTAAQADAAIAEAAQAFTTWRTTPAPVRGALADHPDEETISLLAISASNLETHPLIQLELPLGLADEKRHPGARQGAARLMADTALDRIRDRFGWSAAGYGSVALETSRSVPDEFRELAEKDL